MFSHYFEPTGVSNIDRGCHSSGNLSTNIPLLYEVARGLSSNKYVPTGKP